MVEGVNNTQVHLAWNFTDNSSFIILIDRERPDGSQNTRIASRIGAAVNVFNPGYDVNLPATLVIKEVTRNDEFVYILIVSGPAFNKIEDDSVAVKILCKY